MRYSRRDILKLTGGLLAAGPLTPRLTDAQAPDAVKDGLLSGPPRGIQIGSQILRDGGNAIDAAVAAALAAGVTAPAAAGIGGYGGHLVIALKNGRVTAIDFNSTAPRAARFDMFRPTATGQVPGAINAQGWLAAGVPGILAGLQLALDKYGTKSFREVVAPAIQLAREGVPVAEPFHRNIANAAPWMHRDPGSARLYFRDGAALPVGAVYRNPDLAAMLETLAADNSVESFYRGEIGRRIAAAFKAHGGLVTPEDMAAYRARESAPLVLHWRGCAIHTAPLAAGGLTVLQALGVLKALRWESLPAGAGRTQALVETLRLAWGDRLRLLGDPDKVTVPVDRLLSEEYAREMAQKVSAAITSRKPVPIQTPARVQPGTIHMNSVDRHGNMVALTITQGGPFGAGVTVDGLGLTLGHGMARFDVEPGHPNAPGPGKRPLTNMCPTVVVRGGAPVLSVGAAGTRTIPNAVFNVLVQFVAADAAVETAVAAQRIHTEGNLDLTVDAGAPAADLTTLRALGYRITDGFVGSLNAIAVDPQTAAARAAAR